MGMFSSKVISVSSSVYNLAGEEENRVDFLKTAILGATLRGNGYIGEQLTQAYQNGPATKLRQFSSWAKNNDFDDAMGMATGQLFTGDNLDYDVLQSILPVNTGTYAEIQTVDVDFGMFTHWGLQFIMQHHPELIGTTYTLDYDSATNLIKIVYADGSIEQFEPNNFDASKRYIYVTYTENVNSGEFIQADDPVYWNSPSEFPATTGWTVEAVQSVPTDFVLTTTTRVQKFHLSDTLVEDTTTTADAIQNALVVTRPFTKNTLADSYAGISGIYSIHALWEQHEYWEIEYTTEVSTAYVFPHYIRTTVTSPVLVPKYSTQLTETINTAEAWQGTQMWMYQKGSGNAILDAMFQPSTDVGQFLPIIPFRIDNVAVDTGWKDSLYPKCKRAFVKATGVRYDKVMKKVNDNESIGQLDYVYAVFGVSLNVEEQACRQYLFKFFETLMLNAGSTGMPYAEFKAQFEAATASWEAWIAWREAYNSAGDSGYVGSQPTILPYPAYTPKSIHISSAGEINYHVAISWDFLDESNGAGLLKPDAKPNTIWWESGSLESLTRYFYSTDGEGSTYLDTQDFTTDTVVLCWQVTNTFWRKLTIHGLTHTNYVWGGKTVVTSAQAAISASEESPFIVPLHDEIYHSIGIRNRTQMATASSFLVFNCYQVYKKKWYQTGWFMVVIIIIIIIITVLTWGSATAPTSAGLLGTNAAVGAAMGIAAGTAAAAIAGAIANAIAAMIVSMLIMKAANKFIGGTLGMVIGVIASIVTLQVGSALASGQSVATAFSSMASAQGLMQLTLAAGNGYAGYLQQSAKNMSTETSQLQEQATETLNQIQKKIQELSDNNGIDLNVITSAVIGSFGEPRDAFLTRTLMTGSDICDMSMSMLSDFVEMTINTDLL